MKVITLLRKPLEGTVAENTLKYGCGGINIDATRVGTEVMTSIAMGSLGVMHDDGWKSKPIDPVESTGRWAANFILTHLEGCESQEEKWACVEGCPVREMDSQSGHQKSGVAGNKSRAWGVAGKGTLSSTEDGVGWKAYGSEGYGDEGGASRFFMQFQKGNK